MLKRTRYFHGLKGLKVLQVALAFLGALLIAVPLFGAALEAKKDDVKVYGTPAKTGETLSSLKKGQTVEGKERKGMYWEVVLDGGKTGYVSVLEVTAKTDSKSNLTNALRSAVKEGRQEDEVANARSRSSVMGVRGLAADDENKSAGNVKPNLRMVYAMEDFTVSKQKIEDLKQKVEQEIEARAKKQGL